MVIPRTREERRAALAECLHALCLGCESRLSALVEGWLERAEADAALDAYMISEERIATLEADLRALAEAAEPFAAQAQQTPVDVMALRAALARPGVRRMREKA